LKSYEVPLSFQVRCACAHGGCCEAAFSSVRSYKDHSGAVKIEAKFFTHPDRPIANCKACPRMVTYLSHFSVHNPNRYHNPNRLREWSTSTIRITIRRGPRVCVFRKALRHSVQPHLVFATIASEHDSGRRERWTMGCSRLVIRSRRPFSSTDSGVSLPANANTTGLDSAAASRNGLTMNVLRNSTALP
jgi:hypothetical protein